MNQLVPENNYTFDSGSKEITLLAPYNSLEIAQIIYIKDLSTTEVLYDPILNDEPISLSAGVITHTHTSSSSSQANTDILAIMINPGGSTSIPIYTGEGEGAEASGYESVSVAGSAVGLTSGTYGDAIKAVMSVEEAQIRFRIDGVSPTSNEGHLGQIGDIITLYSASDIAGFEAIRTGSTSGVLKVTYLE